MVYDVADGYLLLFDSVLKDQSYFSNTWKFSNGVWTNITTSPAPSPRGSTAMAYDAGDGYVILFGGEGFTPNQQVQGDTWKFSGGIWSAIPTSQHPSPRAAAAMAYDGGDGYVILFGGFNTTGGVLNYPGDTWKFSGGSWASITTSGSPSPRSAGSMDYDAADGYVVLFGGLGYSNTGDTWKFSGRVWTDITTCQHPSPRISTAMAYDFADRYVLLFGGQSPNLLVTQLLDDAWKFSAGLWTNIMPTGGPSAREGASMAYDAKDGYVILFGGSYLHDTWTATNMASGNIVQGSCGPINPSTIVILALIPVAGVAALAAILLRRRSGMTSQTVAQK